MPTFDQVKDDYASMWASVALRPDRAKAARTTATRVMLNRARYEEVGGLTGVPWWFIGIIHALECSCDFGKHLHNGDPLSAKTRRVPAGRPVTWVPPYDWKVSAADALNMKGFGRIRDWTVERACYEWERYNGWGYRKPGMPASPYLWSGTNHYSKGKYVRDHVYDPEHVSKQSGTLAILKALLEIDPDLLSPTTSAPAIANPAPAAKELRQTSRKFRLSEWMRWLFGGGTALAAGGNAAHEAGGDPWGIISQVAELIRNYGFEIAIGAGFAGFAAFQILRHFQIQDAEQGRYVPSGDGQ